MSVTYELHEHVARVTIDRPDVLNAIDASTETMLQEIWSELENEPDVPVEVVDVEFLPAREFDESALLRGDVLRTA